MLKEKKETPNLLSALPEPPQLHPPVLLATITTPRPHAVLQFPFFDLQVLAQQHLTRGRLNPPLKFPSTDFMLLLSQDHH
jgi:hypothetical protein